MNTLENKLNYLCARPNDTSTTMSKAELREALLQSDGWIMACGEAWEIKNKHFGAGVYKVWLEQRP